MTINPAPVPLDQVPAGQLTPLVGTDKVPVLRTSPNLQWAYVSELQGVPGMVAIYPSGDATGATDTAAIQAALNTGAVVYLAPGVFYTSATLTVTTAASHGQKLFGAGPSSHLGTGALCTIVRPTSAVSTFLKVDGTSFGGYVENFSVESFTLDMTHMADTSSSVGFLQIQAWSARYRQVQVINDAANKLGWSLQAGAYITLLDTCSCNWLSFVGTSDANQVTTVTVVNHDGNNVTMNYCANMQFISGAYQGSGTRFMIRNTATIAIETDVEGTGTYLNVDNTVIGLRSFTELQGFSGTYRTGTPGVNSFVFDDIAPYSSYVWSMGSGGFSLNNAGVSGNSRFLSGALGTQYYLGMGRTGLDLVIGVAGATNDFFGYDTAAGDTVITTYAGNMWLGINEAPIVEVTSAGINVLGDISATAFGTVVSPTINAKTLYVKPGSDIGSVFAVSTAAGVGVINVGTSGTPSLALINGSPLYGYSDNGSTLKFTLSASSGIINTVGAYQVSGTQVVGARATGWTAGTGTINKGAFATYAGQTWGVSYSQTLAQTADNAIVGAHQRILALEQALRTHGLIGT